MDIDEVIELFNDTELDVEKYFNDSDTFFKIMDKRGRINDLDLENNYMENDYLLYLSQTNTEKFREEVAKGMTEAADKMKEANLDTSLILFSMWTESIKEFAEKGKGNVIFLDGSVDNMQQTMRQMMANDLLKK